jgi:hypothetical protein
VSIVRRVRGAIVTVRQERSRVPSRDGAGLAERVHDNGRLAFDRSIERDDARRDARARE